MPMVALPTGADLYYETSGEGEALVLIPSTGFSCEVWKPSQTPLQASTRLVIHDPRGCGRTVMEVSNWVFMDDAEKQAVWVRIRAEGYPRRPGTT